jgi:hypothetical protein
VKHSKFIAFFWLLLLLLQPALTFASVDTEILIVNQQEEFSLFKTKSSQALVLHETSIQTIEISESFPFNYQGEYAVIHSALSKKKRLLSFDSQNSDKKHLLASQIFPFHFHF